MSDDIFKKPNWKHKYRNLKRQQERKEFTDWTEENFIDHIFELRDELDALQQNYDQLKVSDPKAMSEEIKGNSLRIEDFKQDWSYPIKFVFLLSLENRPLTSMEIHNHLLKLDKGYNSYFNPKSTLSVYLRATVKTGRIVSVKFPGAREKLFMMPEWEEEKKEFLQSYKRSTNQF